MWTWILTLIKGWLPSTGKRVGKIIWVIGIVLMVMLCSNILDKLFPSKPQVVNVEGDYIQEKKDVANFGCALWRGYGKVGIRQ